MITQNPWDCPFFIVTIRVVSHSWDTDVDGKDLTNQPYTSLPFCSFKSHESVTLSGHKEVVSHAWGANFDSMLIDHGERSDHTNYCTPKPFMLIQISWECSFKSSQGWAMPIGPRIACWITGRIRRTQLLHNQTLSGQSFKSHVSVPLNGGESCLGPQRW